MRDSVDAYFDQQNVYDINVQSTYGLTRDALAAIQEVDGVETAEGIYTETAYTAVGTTRERVVVQSLSKENICLLYPSLSPRASHQARGNL